MINKNKSKTTFPSAFPSFWAQLHCQFLYLLPPEWHRRMENGGCSQFFTCSLRHSFLLILLPCSTVGSHPWEAVLHKILQNGSFPWPSFLCEVLQCVSFPKGAVVQEQTALSCILQGATGPARRPAFLNNTAVPDRKLFQCRLFTGPQLPSWYIYLIWAEVLCRLQSGYLLHHGPPLATVALYAPPQAAGDSLFWHLKHLIPLLLHSLWCLHSCFSHVFPLLSPSCS